MFTNDDISVLVLESERLMYNPPSGPLGDALYETVVAQAQKAHAVLMGCQESVLAGSLPLSDDAIQGNVTRAVLALGVARLLVACDLKEHTDAGL